MHQRESKWKDGYYSLLKCNCIKSGLYIIRAAKKGAGGKLPPGPQDLRGLITPKASRSGGPHKLNQQ